jgi:hypothetical protein
LSPLSECINVRAMKNKSHISNWAIALCAVVVFSFSASVTAHAARLPDPQPLPTVTPVPQVPGKPLQPVPPVAPPVGSGIYTGTVIGD